jgi:hypothetical protein
MLECVCIDLPTRHDLYVAFTSQAAQVVSVEDLVASAAGSVSTAHLVGLDGIHYLEDGDSPCYAYRDDLWPWLYTPDDGVIDMVSERAAELGADIVVLLVTIPESNCCGITGAFNPEVCYDSEGHIIRNVSVCNPWFNLGEQIADAIESDPADAAARRCATVCPVDYDGNGSVGIGDLLSVLSLWGTASGEHLLAVIENWGPCP